MQRRTRPPYTNGDPLSFFTPDADGTYRVAVVGNGPLHEEDRIKINRSLNVVRFNDMNYWRSGEKVSLRAVHYPFARPPQTACTAPVWGLAPSPVDLPDSVALYTWTYEPALTHASINMVTYAFFPKVQVLEPWQEVVQFFEGCQDCGLKCYSNQTSSGPSAGAVTLSELNSIPQVSRIDVFGMNWNGGLEHVDFKYPDVVPSCCTKCTIHPTATAKYGDKSIHLTESVRNLILTSSASGISLVVGVAVAAVFVAHHTHKTVKRHIERKFRKKSESEMNTPLVSTSCASLPTLSLSQS